MKKLDNCRSNWLPMDEQRNLFSDSSRQLKLSMKLKLNVLKYIKNFSKLCTSLFFLSLCYLNSISTGCKSHCWIFIGVEMKTFERI